MSSTPVPSPPHAVQVLSGTGSSSGAHVRSLTAGLVAHGLRVTVCAPRAAEYGHRFTAAGARFTPVDALTGAGGVAAVRAAGTGAGLVHAHGLRAGMLAALALRGRRTPLVVTWHTRPSGQTADRRTVRLMEHTVARSAAVVLGASSDLVDRARQRGARDARLAPVALPPLPTPAGDDCGRGKFRAELGVVDRPLLLTAGRLVAERGYESLLDACRELRGLDPPPLLAVAGEGPARDVLQRRIDAEGLPVRLLGHREDLPELLAASDLALLCSPWEARPALAQWALHAGVPLVATAVGGVPDLVGEGAELVPYGDPYTLARTVRELLADPVRRTGLAAAGRAQAAGWPGEEDMVAHVLGVYDELTDGFGNGRHLGG
ncbi:glycosyltransferase family 4 protein [Streptomyces palmae]|uniref:glycosyltransferase family 4 protein n=1 Tax=Streptomyces palmae TaxID=1701085 RepID=UPI001FD7AE32|nr:glycosyltransferase family 4 protein [Streptomyces palmae]